MGVEIRTFNNKSTDIQIVLNTIADELIAEQQFALTFKGTTAEGYSVKLKKSGFLRQFSGLVYTFDIVAQRQGDMVVVKVDDGDIRNQLASLGVGLLVVWPVLITAGYGWMRKGELRKEVLDKAKKSFNLNTAM